MPSCFTNMLEGIFPCFAKIGWMPSSYTKLLELLLEFFSCVGSSLLEF
jgi:hypothetical protein